MLSTDRETDKADGDTNYRTSLVLK